MKDMATSRDPIGVPESQRPAYETWGVARQPRISLDAALQPLLRHLGVYESILGLLRHEGGRVQDLHRLLELMRRPIRFPGLPDGPEASLAEPARIRDRLHRLHAGVDLELRKGPVGFPVHYLFRTSRDDFGNYTLILDDLHRGGDYDRFDARWDRFASATRYGEVDRLLRLSPLRPAAEAAAGRSDADVLLYTAGRTLFDAAWHDDQRLACAAAELLELPRFRSTLELCYLCLGGDLSRLRQALLGPWGAPLTAVVAAADPGGALLRLVDALPATDGAQLSGLREAAHRGFPRLGAAFAALMRSQRTLDRFPADLPLFKILVAHYRRLDRVRPLLNADARRAGAALEDAAIGIGEEILGPLSSRRLP
ncbi:MAG: hypothetical protein ABIK09_12920 [Pseudomonadota bacterium]